MSFYWHFSVNAAVNREILHQNITNSLISFPILMCKRSALFIPVKVHCGSSTCLWTTPTGFTLHYAVWLLYGSNVLWESLITCKLSIQVEDECFNYWGGWETHACHVQVWSGCTCLMFCTVSRAVQAPGGLNLSRLSRPSHTKTKGDKLFSFFLCSYWTKVTSEM